MKDYALLIDYKYCTGCHSCEIACNQEYDRPLGLSGIKVLESTMIHRNKHYINFIPVRTHLCNFCLGRIKKGKKPACVHHCLAGCLEIVNPSEVLNRPKSLKRKLLFL